MKVTIQAGSNTNDFLVTNQNAAARHAEKKTKGEHKTTIYAGDLGVHQDSILLKRKQAQKQAMKIVGDVFESDKKVDQSMQELSDTAQGLQEQKKTALEELKRIDAEKAELDEHYDASQSGEEQQNIELRRQELDEEEAEWKKAIASSEAGVKGIQSSLRDTKLERLKSDPMQAAQGQAEEILEAANKAIIGDLMSEAKEHIEEKMQEEKEKAEKMEEKKEELEEKLKAKDEKEEKMEEWIESTKELTESKQQVDKELDEILDDLKLLEDDLKGAAVDANL